MKLSNKTYNVLKFIAIVALPAFVTLVGTIGSQFGYNMTDTVAILTAVDTFLGTLLGLSTSAYNKEKAQEDKVEYTETSLDGVTNDYDLTKEGV